MFQQFCTHGIRDRKAGRPWRNSFLVTMASQKNHRVEVFQKELIFEREKGWTANRRREE